MLRTRFLSLFAVVLGAAGACGGTTIGDSPSVGATCHVAPDATLGDNGNGPGQTRATGSVSGGGVSGSICNVGVVVTTSDDDLAPGGKSTVLYLASGSGTPDTCSTPSGTLPVSLQGSVAIRAAAPGVYRIANTPAGNNNDVDLAYELPLPAGLDCGDATGAPGEQCPAGCIPGGCIERGDAGGVFCAPCEPDQMQEDWTALTEDGGQNIGSWTVTLTSVEPVVDGPDSGLPAGTRSYSVHGSLQADLVGNPVSGTGAGQATTTLSLSF